jgi:RimJ/RimL family protein N-acetyltransferase
MMDWFGSGTITLRPLDVNDVSALHAMANDPTTCGRRYFPWSLPQAAPLSAKQVEAALEEWGKRKKALTLGIAKDGVEPVVGYCDCDWDWDPHCPSVSVVVDPAHRRTGIGSIALRLLLTYLFEQTPAHNVNGWIDSWNEPALAFARARGFAQSGTVPRIGLRNGRYVDGVLVDILRPEWAALGGDCGA